MSEGRARVVEYKQKSKFILEFNVYFKIQIMSQWKGFEFVTVKYHLKSIN